MSFSNNEKRDIIMSHYLNPAFKKAEITNKIVKYGESCADYLEFEFTVENNKIMDIAFNGSGCAFFIASTDILCSYLKGMDLSEFPNFVSKYGNLINGNIIDELELNNLGELAVFQNVKQHYNRLNCVLMLLRPLKEKLLNEK
ncbi:iron-sulfur cluster assembly scaffold protein [Mycoplasmopsis felifaucium]|uniref:iron-sulfur cluster assembly scaffold protein n=1 Tax=Mycoplasmopsis felifaucium TaxID=35768 RepID=UPI000B0E5197|nr:iron-sulfur cluster assembly scaffold protein [Mycoplasmopsis felifaucium]